MTDGTIRSGYSVLGRDAAAIHQHGTELSLAARDRATAALGAPAVEALDGTPRPIDVEVAGGAAVQASAELPDFKF